MTLRDRIAKWASVSRDYQKQCAAEKSPYAASKSEFHRGAAEAFERVLDELREPDDLCKRESCGHKRKHHRANGCMGWSGHVCTCAKFLETKVTLRAAPAGESAAPPSPKVSV